MDRTKRIQLWIVWFRLVSICYFFRAMTTTLTSLPGPAPHCADHPDYYAPTTWFEIATDLGPLVGSYDTCGDLLFSGHAAWVTVTVLMLVRQYKHSKYYGMVKILGFIYLLVMCVLAIAGRKHYSVDMTLGNNNNNIYIFIFRDIDWITCIYEI